MASNSLNRGYIGINQFSSTNGIPDSRNRYLNIIDEPLAPLNISPSFVLDFTGTTWSDYITFTRGNSAFFLGSSGYLTQAGTNVPRIQYDRFGNTLGIYIEQSCRQYLTSSEEFTNAYGVYWTRTRLILAGTTSAGTAPDGTSNATAIIPDTVANYHSIARLVGIGGAAGTPTTFSFFAKQMGNTYKAVSVYNGFSTLNPVEDGYSFTVDLTNGNVSNVAYSGNAQGTNVRGDFSHFVEPYPNNWWRISCSGRAIQSNRYLQITPFKTTTSIGNEAGTGVDGILIWGASISNSSFPLTYYTVLTTAYNSDSDNCIVRGSSFSSWFTTNGSFSVEFYNKQDYFNQAMYQTGNNDYPAAGSPTAFSTQYSYQKIMAVGNVPMDGNKNFGLQLTQDSLLSTKGYSAYQQLNKAAFTFTGTGSTYTISFCLNGSQVQEMQTNNLRPNLINWMTIGSCGLTSSSGFFGHYNGVIKKVSFYSPPLSNNQLKAITTNV